MIASLFKKLFAPDPLQAPAHAVYVRLVEQARKPFFYTEAQVPDTLDGRFDVIVLHLFLLTEQLKQPAPEFLRAVWEVFFADMDRSLREMGASDTGIGKRIKKMVQAFYGRITAYEHATNDTALAESLERNLYRGQTIDGAALNAMVRYIARNRDTLRGQTPGDIVSGQVTFCD